ncbi:MAG TPA: gluconokinase [Candidatus Sulfomarinibacteraceae bacterium]|nr:gluconokinase [Candidatus Sulfomarinibacteraceae bacterium]
MTEQPHTPWFLGIDLGTSSCKSIIVNDQAQILGLAGRGYDAANARSQWQEQDPQALLAGLVASVRAAIEQAGVAPQACAGLSVGGAMHGLMALDDHDAPLTGVITWADGRAAAQAEAVRASDEAADLYQETGCPVHATYPLYKLLWLRQERPHIFAQAARFVSAKEYAVAFLTGHFAVDYCTAAGSGLLNTHTLEWNPRSLALAQIESRQLSPLAGPLETLAPLNEDAARQLGLPATTPLVLGATDAANSSLGTGAVRAGQAACMVGTSGALRLVASAPLLDAQGQVWSYAIDGQHWLVGGAINNGGVALTWLRDMLNALLPQANRRRFQDLLALAQSAPPGANGLLCLPFFSGERSPDWNVNARGVFFGLTLHHDAGHLARAVLEGVAFRMRSIADMLADAGLDPVEVRASGGFTKSGFWLQLMADVLGRELTVPDRSETSALGAAFWAMRGAGAVRSMEQMADLVPARRVFSPAEDAAAIYDPLYALYRRFYRDAAESFDQIAGLQQQLAHQHRQNGKD